ncbi:S41 family peptidase [Caulobacter sp. S45]|uniref:S41 family peptidase n=1 Tax=Caulobacter sp. S45 TaxID=1641861 RepID=UPI00131C7A1F|nr:S41 family peptidase [Caulobacter sp. S45]
MRKILLIGISTFALGAAAMAYADQQQSHPPKADTYKMLELFGDVLTTVDQQYVVPVDNKKLIQAALDGMLTSLDPHSGYLDPDSFDDMRDQTRGEYGGLGLQVTAEDGAVRIISPMDDTPASRAHIQPGDYITAIEGQSILGQSLNDAVKQMRGPVGTSISLTIARDKTPSFTVKLTREIIEVKSVTHRLEGDYGYLHLSGFDEKTGAETASAIRDMKAKNPHLKGLVLDLRNNPGGLVDQAVDVAGDFLNGGEVVSQRGRDAKDITRYNGKVAGDLIHGLPMVVLINGGSASASEIVAGALKDRERATIVGLTSFGKGSVQTVIPLHGGVDGALKLTTDRYYTPSGGSIQKTGIAPDLFVAQSKKQAEAVYDTALQYTEAAFKNALDAQEGRKRFVPTSIEIPAALPTTGIKKVSLKDDDQDEDEPPPAPKPSATPDDKNDFQLQRALDVLKYGSVEAAERAKPVKSYSKPTPKFITAQAGPAPTIPGGSVPVAAAVKPAVAAPSAAKKP